MRALKAAEDLKQEKIFITIVNVPTLKPVNKEAIAQHLESNKLVIALEDHNIIGGLGSAIAETIAEEIPVPLLRIGLRDKYPESGESEQLLDHYGMGIPDIVNAAKRVFQKKRG